jgi:hypothetical protein
MLKVAEYVAIIEAHTSLSLAILWDLQQINIINR